MGTMDGKVVLVTGAAGAIGSAVARWCARQGASLALDDLGTAPDGSGRDPGPVEALARELAGAGAEVEAFVEDVATSAGVEALFAGALRRFGHLDALVCSSGLLLERSLLRTDEADWDRVQSAHLGACWRCTQRAAQAMVQQEEGGRIVLQTSLAGLFGAYGQASYAAATAGIYGLTRGAAVELQKHHITVNAVAPVAKTRLTEHRPELQGLDLLTAEHVVPAIAFFASPLCRDRTGEVLGVAGSRVYRLKIAESTGKFKEGPEPWTPEEIGEHWDAIAKP
jgi:NAD(P)-dependent dehydrogenase (short-subunit alcohol dehydrogenase family)